MPSLPALLEHHPHLWHVAPPPVLVVEGLFHEDEELDGAYDSDLEMIVIEARALAEGRTTLRVTLIHELAHVVVTEDDGEHGELWRARMYEASYRAKELGEVELAEALLCDVGEEAETAQPKRPCVRYHQG